MCIDLYQVLTGPVRLSQDQRQIENTYKSICSGEGNGIPLQYSCLENPMDGGAWKPAVHGVAEGWTRLSDFSFTFHFHALQKEMATHSSVLAWRIQGWGSLVGCRLWGRTELNTTEVTQQQQQQQQNLSPLLLSRLVRSSLIALFLIFHTRF